MNACRVADGKQALSLAELVEREIIRYIDFPDSLKGKYQSFTQADISKLREAGYDYPFFDVDEGVSRYVHWLLQQKA